MVSIMTPGVYVKEVSTGTRPFQPAGSSTVGFLGFTPQKGVRVNEAVPIKNWADFCNIFVGDAEQTTPLATAVYGFFANRGSRCFVLNLGDEKASLQLPMQRGQRRGIAKFEEIDEIAIVAAPGYTGAEAHDALLTHCESMGRFAILDLPRVVEDLEALKEVATASAADAPPAAPGARPASKGLHPRVSVGGYGAAYFPWITVKDPIGPEGKLISSPPSGFVAGIYAQTDAQRGVHKAPANVVVAGAYDVAYRVTASEQGPLNQAGINCLRFIGNAIRVWGARTLDEPGSEWTYVPVRRLFLQVRKTIEMNTNYVVFEPNDPSLWKSITRDVTNFLMGVWRSGALVGATPAQAFFVKCDEENNPPDEIDLGRVNIDIGIAPVKPAEFVIFRIGQYVGGAAAAAPEKPAGGSDG